MNGKDRIEQVRQANAVSFRRQSVLGAIAVEAPWLTYFDDIDPWLIVPKEDLFSDPTFWRPVHHRQSIRTMPLDLDDRNQGVRNQAPDGRFGQQVFEFRHLGIHGEG